MDLANKSALFLGALVVPKENIRAFTLELHPSILGFPKSAENTESWNFYF